eukprot:4081688-Amphidinium_carterae.1
MRRCMAEAVSHIRAVPSAPALSTCHDTGYFKLSIIQNLRGCNDDDDDNDNNDDNDNDNDDDDDDDDDNDNADDDHHHDYDDEW